jgi:hypothetical protein
LCPCLLLGRRCSADPATDSLLLLLQVKELGRGCFGSVWLAKWRGVEVALKELLNPGVWLVGWTHLKLDATPQASNGAQWVTVKCKATVSSRGHLPCAGPSCCSPYRRRPGHCFHGHLC